MEPEIENFLKRRRDTAWTRSGALTNQNEPWPEITSRMPEIVTLETTTICNLRCVMCPQSYPGIPNPQSMSVETVERLMKILSDTQIIEAHGVGEPIANPRFFDILNVLEPLRGREIVINCNGHLLTEQKIDQLLKSVLTLINFSLDAATPETYKRIRGGDFNNAVRKIRNLIKERNRRKLGRPKVYINMTLMRENIEELPRFIELGADLNVDGVHFSQMNDWEATPGWVVERDGWKFVYEDQLLKHYPELSNQKVREASERAEVLGVPIIWDQNKTIFLDESEARR